jgi:hypothetical protein
MTLEWLWIILEFTSISFLGSVIGLSDLPEAQSETVLPGQGDKHLLSLLRHGT